MSNAVKEIKQSAADGVIEYFKKRGISETTVRLFGIVGGRAFFPDLRRETEAVSFPYVVDGKTAGYKLRSLEEKAHVCSSALKSAFGIQNVDLVEEGHLLITEGEIDALSLYESGVLNAVSVPNGAQSFGTNENNDFLWSVKPLIDKAKKIIIATDNDEPGAKLAEEIARRIGRHKCWKLVYPDGCKDANDVLVRHGGDVLAASVEGAEPWPIAGIYDADRYKGEVFDLLDSGFSARVSTGYDNIDRVYSVNPGLLTVVTGIPGNGKSQFLDQIMVNLAIEQDYNFVICSFENPVPVHIGKLAQIITRRSFFSGNNKMTKKELTRVYGFIADHFKFMQQDDGAKATKESVIERIKVAVLRYGIKGAVIDPLNYIERPKSADSETGWLDELLTELRLTAVAYDLHIWLVAHPTKMPMDSEGNYQIPKGYSVSGSAAFFSKPDFGLTVHRTDDMGGTKIINWKTRFDWLGCLGEEELVYDAHSFTYRSIYGDMPPTYDPLPEGVE